AGLCVCVCVHYCQCLLLFSLMMYDCVLALSLMFSSLFLCVCRCSEGRGYRLPPSALINLSHGCRLEQGSHKLTAIIKPQPSASSQHPHKGQLAGLHHSPRSPFIPTQVRDTHTHTHTHIYKHTHTHTHTHIYKHTRTHTHT